MPTPAEYAASLVGSEVDNVKVLSLVRAAIAARTVLVVSPVAAPPTPGSTSYLEVHDRMRNGANYDALVETIEIGRLIRNHAYTEAKWNQLINHFVGLASSARTSYADVIIAELGAP